MMFEIPSTAKCDCCNKKFSIDEQNAKRIKEAIERGSDFVFLECPLCWGHPSITFGTYQRIKPSSLIPCPEPYCWGDVMKLKKGQFDNEKQCWQCGECGCEWATQNILDEQISCSIQKTPARRKLYKKLKNGHWAAVYPRRVSEDYIEKIMDKEAKDDNRNEAIIKKADPNDVPACTRLVCHGTLVPYTKMQLEKKHGQKFDRGRWECDHCDTAFESREEIEAAIEELVEKYPHRKMAYKKVKGHWLPTAASRKPSKKYERALQDVESVDFEKELKKRKKTAPRKK